MVHPFRGCVTENEEKPYVDAFLLVLVVALTVFAFASATARTIL